MPQAKTRIPYEFRGTEKGERNMRRGMLVKWKFELKCDKIFSISFTFLFMVIQIFGWKSINNIDIYMFYERSSSNIFLFC